jgi:hypothetical protein
VIHKAKQALLEYISEYIIPVALFLVVLTLFQVKNSQQDAEMITALQTIERIKFKWTLIEE